MKIIELSVKNFKKIAVAEIHANGGHVTLGGNNGAGKSSAIDAILSAIAGARATCSRPIRDGASKSLIGLDFDNGLSIRKVLKANGGAALEVRNAKGDKIARGQTILDSLTGGVTDISQVVSLPPADLAALLRDVGGVDTSELDSKRASLYSERADANREAKRLKVLFEQQVEPPVNTPDEEVSIAKAIEAMNAMRREEREANDLANDLAIQRDLAERCAASAADKRIAARSLIEEADQLDLQAKNNFKRVEDAEGRLPDMDRIHAEITALEQTVAEADQTNQNVRAKQSRAATQLAFREATRSAETLSSQIEDIDEQKTRALAGADLPIEGLTVNDEGVSYNGVPFNQCGEAEKYMIAAAIALKRVPKEGIRVILMRTGGTLDPANLEKIKNMTSEHDAQLWIEVPRNGDDVDVLFEEGRIVAPGQSTDDDETEPAMAVVAGQGGESHEDLTDPSKNF